MVVENVDVRFTQAVVSSLDHIIADTEMGSLTRFNKIVLLRRCLSMTRTAAALVSMPMTFIGADVDHLKKTTCLEIDFKGAQGLTIADFNAKLVDQDEGLLAEAISKERYTTLGCSQLRNLYNTKPAGCEEQRGDQGCRRANQTDQADWRPQSDE